MPRSTSQLALTGRLIIWASRHWARARRQGRDLPGFVLHTLDQLPDGPVIRATLEALLAQLTLGARRPLALAAPEDGCLTRDELTLLSILIAARFGFEDEIRLLLMEHQHRCGLRSSSETAGRLGERLRTAGLSLCGSESVLERPAALLVPATRSVH
ncbi:MAG: hypothetical protein U5R48_16030 [Gammaproteobacteria bacterium]|nr:hypothetical protein [Gammaproteobacteria bacterium]